MQRTANQNTPLKRRFEPEDSIGHSKPEIQWILGMSLEKEFLSTEDKRLVSYLEQEFKVFDNKGKRNESPTASLENHKTCNYLNHSLR
jgi:hypothetical protein